MAVSGHGYEIHFIPITCVRLLLFGVAEEIGFSDDSRTSALSCVCFTSRTAYCDRGNSFLAPLQYFGSSRN